MNLWVSDSPGWQWPSLWWNSHCCQVAFVPLPFFGPKLSLRVASGQISKGKTFQLCFGKNLKAADLVTTTLCLSQSRRLTLVESTLLKPPTFPSLALSGMGRDSTPGKGKIKNSKNPSVSQGTVRGSKSLNVLLIFTILMAQQQSQHASFPFTNC